MTVGRIVRPHGVKGQVEIVPLTDSPQRFQSGRRFELKPPIAGRESIKLTDVAWKKDRVVATVEGVDDRRGAEALVGHELMIPESKARKPAGSYWHHEIIGCQVVTEEGRRLGRVTEILRTGAGDVYVVDDDRRYLIPATKDVIKKIDVDRSLIKIKPLPGLLEL